MMNDWTGSARARREQGSCSPPQIPPNDRPRFTIHVGTELWVRRVAGPSERWRRHQTKQQLTFRRAERCRHGQYTFRQHGWFIRVAVAKVKDSVGTGRNGLA